MVDRRRFLIHAGAAILAAPTISTLKPFNFSNLGLLELAEDSTEGGSDLAYPVDRTLERLLERHHGGNPFVAQASMASPVGSYVGDVKVLSAPVALWTIFDHLELPKSFSNRVDYREASQCRQNFERHESELRRHYSSFTNVERSPADRDVAFLAGGNIDSRNVLQSAQGASQFRNYRSVGLSDDDPGLVLAASALIHQDYAPNRQEVAQSFAVTHRRPQPLGDGQSGTRYETPVHSVIHDPRPRRNFPRGVVFAHNKKQRDRSNLYYAGLYV
jgi:hypothetical protein